MTLLVAACVLGQSIVITETPRVEESFGVSLHADQIRDGGLAKVAELGLGWIRIDLSWDKVEKKKGAFDFAEADGWVADCERLGLRALFILDYWHDEYGGPSMRSDAAINGFARFAREAAARYRGRPVAWEIWNEPNIPQFWKPKPDAEEYRRVALAACRAIREANPNATIVAPGLAGMDLTYLKSVLEPGELANLLDGVSVHPYREGAPESALPEVGELRTWLDTVAPGRTLALVNSEWGYSTANHAISETTQAEYAARIALTGYAAGFSLGFWYDLRDDGDDDKEREHRFGLFDRQWRPRKAAEYLRTLARELRGYRFSKRLALGGTSEHCLLFERSGRPKLVAWTTMDRPTQVVLPMGSATATAKPLNAPGQSKRPRDGALSITLAPTPLVLEPDGDDPVLRAVLAAPRMPAAIEARSPGDVARLFAPWDATKRVVIRCEWIEGGRNRTLFEKASGGEAAKRASFKDSDWRRLAAQDEPFRLRVVGREGSSEFAQETWVRPIAPFHVRWRIGQDGRPVLGLTNLSVAERRDTIRAKVNGQDRVLTLSPNGREAWASPDPDVTSPKDATVVLSEGPNQGKASVRVSWFDVLSLEDTGYRGTLDVVSGAGGQVAVSPVEGPPGLRTWRSALLVNYDLQPGHAYLEVRPPNESTPLAGRPNRLSFWMHGDGSGHSLRVRFCDSTGQFFQPDLGPIDWVGWRHIEVPLDHQASGRWGGANDGIVHYPIRLRAVLLIEPGRNGGKGSVAVSDFLVQGPSA